MLTPATCCAGRDLVDLTQSKAAAAAGVGESTARSRKGRRSVPTGSRHYAMPRVLDETGVVLLADQEDLAGGRGVRLEGAK
jgi:hypothetical protein